MTARLVINPIRCEGYGYCMELFPGGIVRDDWGFPLLLDVPLTDASRRRARDAIRRCPRSALSILEKPEGDRGA